MKCYEIPAREVSNQRPFYVIPQRSPVRHRSPIAYQPPAYQQHPLGVGSQREQQQPIVARSPPLQKSPRASPQKKRNTLSLGNISKWFKSKKPSYIQPEPVVEPVHQAPQVQYQPAPQVQYHQAPQVQYQPAPQVQYQPQYNPYPQQLPLQYLPQPQYNPFSQVQRSAPRLRQSRSPNLNSLSRSLHKSPTKSEDPSKSITFNFSNL